MVTGWTSVQSMTKTVYHMLKTLSHGVNQTFVTNLHLLRVKLRCKLQKRLRYLTGPLVVPVRNLLLLTKKPPLLPNFYYLHTLFFLQATWKPLELRLILTMQMTDKLGYSTLVVEKPTFQRITERV